MMRHRLRLHRDGFPHPSPARRGRRGGDRPVEGGDASRASRRHLPTLAGRTGCHPPRTWPAQPGRGGALNVRGEDAVGRQDFDPAARAAAFSGWPSASPTARAGRLCEPAGPELTAHRNQKLRGQPRWRAPKASIAPRGGEGGARTPPHGAKGGSGCPSTGASSGHGTCHAASPIKLRYTVRPLPASPAAD